MNPSRQEVAHTLQIIENSLQMPEPVRVVTRNSALQMCSSPITCVHDRDLVLCGLRVLAQLVILALALIGLCSVVERMAGR